MLSPGRSSLRRWRGASLNRTLHPPASRCTTLSYSTHLLDVLDDHVLKALKTILLIQILEVFSLRLTPDSATNAVSTLKQLLTNVSGQEAGCAGEEDCRTSARLRLLVKMQDSPREESLMAGMFSRDEAVGGRRSSRESASCVRVETSRAD